MSPLDLFVLAIGLSMDAFAVSICKGLSVQKLQPKHMLIGVNMILESRHPAEEQTPDFGVKTMLTMAVATSIDALAVGISFAFLQVDIVPAVSFIGAVTFILSAVGVKIGNVFGAKYKSKAELVGGIILVAMGVKILLEHLGVLGG